MVSVLVFIVNFSSEVLWGTENMSGADSDFMAYERWVKMLGIQQEKGLDREKESNRDGFWDEGMIKFDEYCLKYRPDTEVVLRDLTFTVWPKEKIGVVGRTGAGKSTLCLALCRIVEAHSGSIEIDGTDIATVDLQQLRSNIAFIPQDSTLFEGTLRSNIDPLNKHSDEEVYQLLVQASLEDLIDRHELGLDQPIQENGSNLSSGQKQLICICRAILRKCKIVVMDEATANIDINTEQVIQKLIHEKLKEWTVITIAHRLNTIINSDRVLVLDQGKVVDFEKPEVLIKNRSSVFYSYMNEMRVSN
jgi:ATP-binding cassette subfamily C (CFTR/MRP) protein 1